MSTFTENYNLIKPDEADYYDITDFNENMDTLDAALAAQETAMTEVSDKIGSPNDNGSDTVFGLLNSRGGSVVKSIQHVKYTVKNNVAESNISINAVDPNLSIVILERLSNDFGDGCNYIDYTLNSTSLTVTHGNYTTLSGNQIYFGFWIIEFY